MSTASSHSITSFEVLRERYAQPTERAVKKILPRIDRHMRNFIALSPFVVPGVDETLRVNGAAEITVSPDLLALWARGGKQPKAVLRVTVREAFLHCGKALIRSRLWSSDYRVERTALPPYGHMLKDQIACRETADEIQTVVVEGYRTSLN